MWKCPKCGELLIAIGLAIGTPNCPKDGSVMVMEEKGFSPTMSSVAVGGRVFIGNNAYNSGKIKVSGNGELHIKNDLINTGDISINDPQRIKELLIEAVKSSGSIAELGSNVLKTFFSKS